MMKFPYGYKSFVSSDSYKNNPLPIKNEVFASNKKDKILNSISEAFDKLNISDGMTLSFHHHLRNGDYVLNFVLDQVKRRNLKDITIASSSIFPVHNPMSLKEFISYGYSWW